MKYNVNFDIDLKRNPYKGKYIVIEGIDGSGKSTQVENLENYFKRQGRKTVVVAEPRRKDSVIGELIHKILQSKIKVPPESLQYLYSADRAINHKTVIEPALKKGLTVISHRCFWSAIPYGAYDRGINDFETNQSKVLLTALGILSMYHQFIVPDVTFFLDVSVEAAMKRLLKMDKEKELYEKREKLDKIAQGHKWLAKQFPKEITVINGENSAEKIAGEILGYVSSIM